MKTQLFKFTCPDLDRGRWWLTGFTQTDGGFVLNFDSRKQGTIPYYPHPSFVLTQNRNIPEEQMMIELQKYR